MSSRNREKRRETLAIFRSQDDPRAPLTTAEVAESLGCSRGAAADRLEKLLDRGDLRTKAVGEGGRVWWDSTPEGVDTTAAASDGSDGSSHASGVCCERRSVLVVDAEGDVVWIDESVADAFGVEPTDAVGRDREEFELGPSPQTIDLEHEVESIEYGRYAGGRVEFFTAVTDSPEPSIDGNGRGGLFRSLVQATDEYAVFMLDPDGHVISWNEGAERIAGYEESAVVGEHFSVFYTDEDVEAGVPKETISAAIESGSVEDEGWRVREDGTQFWANVTITAMHDDDGELRGFAKVTRDVTDRREWERELEAERNLLEGVVDAVPVSIGIVDRDGEVVLANDRATDRLGIDVDDERSWVGVDLYDEDGEPVTARERPFARAFETREAIRDWRCQIEFPDHGRRWVSMNAVPLTTEEDEVERVVLTVDVVTRTKEQADRLERQRDDLETELDEVFGRVTERREREQTRKQYETVAESTSDVILTIDESSTIRDVNPAVEEVFGYEPSELTGEPLPRLMSDDLAQVHVESIQRYLDTGEKHLDWEYVELPGVRKDGTDISIAVSFGEYEHGGEQFFTGIIREISEQKERERELKQYETLFEEAEDVNAVLDRNGTFTDVTPSAKHVLGYDPDELVGDNAFEYIHPDDREEMVEEYAGVVEDPDYSPVVEFRFEHADGSWVVLEAKGRNLLDDPEINGIVAYTRDATDHKLFEDTLQALNESSRDLIRSDTKMDVSRTAIDAATQVLDLPGVVAYRYDADDDVLTLDEKSIDSAFMREAMPDFPVDHSSIVGHAYCEGEGAYFDDVVESDHLMADPDEVDMRAGSFVPMGDHGVLVVGWHDEGAPDDRTRKLIEILAANAEAAYTRVERERKLEEAERRYRALAENFPDGAVGVYDEDLRYTLTKGTLLGDVLPSSDRMEGHRVSKLFPECTAADLEQLFRAAIEDGETDRIQTEYAGHVFTVWATPLRDADGEIFSGLSFAMDITERVERERELERYETIVETVDDGVYVLDENACFTRVNDAYAEMTGYDREELLGRHCSLVVDDDVSTRSVEHVQEVVENGTGGATLEADIHRADGTTIRSESKFTALPGDAEVNSGKVGVVRDISERIERERELEAKARQQEVIADLGQRALTTGDLDELFDEAVERVTETLDTAYGKVLDLDEGSEELRLRSGVGWKEGCVGTATVGIDRESQAGYTLLADEPVVVEDMDEETRFTGPDLLVDHAVESGIGVVIGSPRDPWGVLGTHDTERREFSENDALFVQSIANILATAIDRHRNEVELESQREQLAALNNLNGVVRDINEALVEQSTREEIERVVCERLANSDSYLFALVAGLDSRTGELESRAEAGVDNYLDDVEISIDDDVPEGQGPAGRAVRSKAVQITDDALADPAHEPWRDAAEEYGYRSSAAIPIVHQDTLYGILGVYTDRVGAFAGEEREVVAQLGEVIGHAIASIERKQALMSDDIVEIDIRLENVLRDVGHTASMDGRITFDETVSVGNGTYLQYGTATDAALETVESLVDQFPHWERVTNLDDGFDEARFELRLSEPPVVSAVANNGGYIDEAVIEDGDMHMSIHLPPTVDVRRVVDTIQDAYSTAEMVTRQQVSRDDSRHRIERALTEELTERQRAAIEASFYAGFFNWPRESSGEEVAESLDVSAPTFHQHLRKAQRKLLETILA